LPDEILVSILSLLPTEEAIRSSVLAPRWRSLWKFTTHLNFADGFVDDDDDNDKAFHVKGRRFVNKATVTQEFRLRFRTYKSQYKRDVDRWIDFALQLGLKSLDLGFRSFPSKGRVDPFDPRVRCPFNPHPRVFHNGCLKSLTTLRLCSMLVSGDYIRYFLFASPLLQSLSILFSTVADLKVSGPPDLKHST
jgi:hypothetical protein